MGTLISVRQAIDTYFVGFIVDTAGYLVLEVFFTVCVICSMIAAALLYLRDASTVIHGYQSPVRQEVQSFEERLLLIISSLW
ncbi:hypothetical protein DPMN_132094 [Dreissena polymorpha]|uniref:Uncharacterized protein n=1 Tax=Dreissena polymorpha TaxID=45954 RepID=A0A9D4J8K1_DREPO|nr:hypothetical protein DPMN_132094 [Dreissena polymorpha]